jgi:hypothetical protein
VAFLKSRAKTESLMGGFKQMFRDVVRILCAAVVVVVSTSTFGSDLRHDRTLQHDQLRSFSTGEGVLVTSSDPAETITVGEDGTITYRYGSEILKIAPVKHGGLDLGGLTLNVKALGTDEQTRSFRIDVTSEGRRKTAIVKLDGSSSQLVHAQGWSEVQETLAAFSASPQGALLQQAYPLILKLLAQEQESKGRIETQAWSAWGCGTSILGGIAGGAALVVGCGGAAACGPLATYCCGGAVAGYGAALMQIADSCSYPW